MTAPTPFQARKVRMSTIDDAEQTPYADYSYAAGTHIPIIESDLRPSIQPTNRRLFVTHNAHLRECLAEFLATGLAIAFGLGGIVRRPGSLYPGLPVHGKVKCKLT
ncbi:hypothetical protein PF008_g29248 [Phytophthora fragariae]|uniref:Uncharacterized protein n=1 Tax=Phytophthora fragariae TaxID=53985 RepID=A0A6G0Q8Z1_9STRA|nr:hypothetical protein PF008_g29248 [Phytophthora fragariae]